MFDPVSFQRKRVTLDWDFSQFSELREMLRYTLKKYDEKISKITVWTSPLKGFHCEIWFYDLMNVAKIRDELKDDGRRIVLDILRLNDIHDVLWTYKNHRNIQSPEKIKVFERVDQFTNISNIY